LVVHPILRLGEILMCPCEDAGRDCGAGAPIRWTPRMSAVGEVVPA
jgi:hypothetical protein